MVQAAVNGTTGLVATNFVDLSEPILLPVTGDTVTNYLDTGAATNTGLRF